MTNDIPPEVDQLLAVRFLQGVLTGGFVGVVLGNPTVREFLFHPLVSAIRMFLFAPLALAAEIIFNGTVIMLAALAEQPVGAALAHVVFAIAGALWALHFIERPEAEEP